MAILEVQDIHTYYGDAYVLQGLCLTLEQGHSILLVEQNAALALQLVDYVHVMSKGQVVYSARPQELRDNEDIKSKYLGI